MGISGDIVESEFKFYCVHFWINTFEKGNNPLSPICGLNSIATGL